MVPESYNYHKTHKTMQNFNKNCERLHNRVAAGKEPVGDFPLPQKGFDKFCKFCE
jgi:hypothetical protein